MSCLLTFPCHYIWTDRNQLTGSIPSELGELTSLDTLRLGTWIGLSCSYECHACSHFLAILFHQMKINSRGQFRANSKNWRCWVRCISVRGLFCLVLMNAMLAWLTLPCHSIRKDDNQLTGSIPSVLGELPLLTLLWLRTWIGLSWSHECHACSHFLAIIFEQIIINSWVQFRANSEN
jgi:hypothetical protein